MKKYLFILIAILIFTKTNAQIDALDTLKICTEISEYDENGLKIAGLKRTLWNPAQNLRIKFLSGDTFLQSKVKHFATEWTKHCNIKFIFVTKGPAEIRINFVTGKGSWSLMGKNSSIYSINPNTGKPFVSSTGTTMNFGWFNSQTPDEEFSRTVIHEFGHAIGLIHEHQSPAAGIAWNKPLVYEYYRRTQNWTIAQIDYNIFRKYSKSETQYSAYDKLSIMHYAIPAHLLLKPEQAVDWNTVLSKIDISFIKKIYPKTKKVEIKKEPTDAHAGDVHGSTKP